MNSILLLRPNSDFGLMLKQCLSLFFPEQYKEQLATTPNPLEKAVICPIMSSENVDISTTRLQPRSTEWK